MTDPEVELHTKVETRDSRGLSVVRELVVHQSVLDAMAGHVSHDTTVEHGGVMLGNVDEKTGTVTITGSIAAVGAVSRVASLTFTHETWDHISEVHEQSFPDSKMVGWYHSHPHFGIFLSDHDLFIHRNFFKEAWQVAYVIDPLLHQEGFFVWEDGDVARLPAWQVISDGGTAQGHLGVQEPARGLVVPPPPPKRNGPIVGMVAVGLAALLVGGALGLLVGREAEKKGPAATARVPPDNHAERSQRMEVDAIECAGVLGPMVTASSRVLYTTDGSKVITKQDPEAQGTSCPPMNNPGLPNKLPNNPITLLAAIQPPSRDPQNDVVALYSDGKIARGGWTQTASLTPSGLTTIAIGTGTGAVPLYAARGRQVSKGTLPRYWDSSNQIALNPVGEELPNAITQIVVWNESPVVLADEALYVWRESQWGRLPDTYRVKAVAAAGGHLWYLTEDAVGIRWIHRQDTLSKQHSAPIRVGWDAYRVLASRDHAWVVSGANGRLTRLDTQGGVDYLFSNGNAVSIGGLTPAAATDDGFWSVVDKRATLYRPHTNSTTTPTGGFNRSDGPGRR